MSKHVELRVWGVRGSGPITAAEYQIYGGNTSCISVECGESFVVFDAGTGLTALGQYLSRRPDIRQVNLFISHLHLDHIIGLFGFAPLSDPGFTLHIYGSGTGGQSFAQMLNTLYGPPYWPVGLSDLPAAVHIHEVTPRTCFLPAGSSGQTPAEYPASGHCMQGSIGIRTMSGNHPGGCLYYRLDTDHRSIAYLLDCEMTPAIRDEMAEFSRNADLIIWDAGFTSDDYTPGWGHSTWEQGLELGRAAAARSVLMTHYDRSYNDTFLQEQEKLASRMNSICRFAREGAVITL